MDFVLARCCIILCFMLVPRLDALPRPQAKIQSLITLQHTLDQIA
jgi:hypothetical protein